MMNLKKVQGKSNGVISITINRNPKKDKVNPYILSSKNQH